MLGRRSLRRKFEVFGFVVCRLPHDDKKYGGWWKNKAKWPVGSSANDKNVTWRGGCVDSTVIEEDSPQA